MAQVSVPATSANLGPGFDSLGLALDLRDRYGLTQLAFNMDTNIYNSNAMDNIHCSKNQCALFVI
jgi:homoserine kinase